MGPRGRRAAFTLIELLLVITIIVIISAVALPVVVSALSHRQVSEGARTLQGAVVGARDEAIHSGRPSGIRLMPDPAFPIRRLANGQVDPTMPLAYNRMVPIAPAPDYNEGRVSLSTSAVYSAAIRTVNGYADVPCLVLEGTPFDANSIPNSPTNWYWNIRVGDKIQINNVGPPYTIVGPMTVGPDKGNAESFVNIGPPGTASPLTSGGEYLLLVNGVDDDGNGIADEGYNGIDDNRNGLIDEAAEWETERWLGAQGP